VPNSTACCGRLRVRNSRRAGRVQKKVWQCSGTVVLAAKTLQGAQPIHVAAFSDVYGYDIECRLPATERIEVKAASENTRHRFHLSRNEYDKSRFFGAEWRLVQVVFSTRAFIAERITAYDIAEVLELDSAALSALIPPDTKAFRWAESAEISAPIEAWRRADLSWTPISS